MALHLYIKEYCWRELLEKRENKNAMLRKYHLENEQIHRKWMPAKFWTEIYIFRKLEEASHTQNLMRKRIDIDFNCLHTGAAHKNKKRLVLLNDLVALAMRFKINPQPDNINFSHEF